MSTIPLIPELNVPWDPAELQGHDCEHCACYFQAANPENPSEFQGFCRRQPADLQELRVMEQRRDLKGNVVMKDGLPVMQPAKTVGFLFRLTQRQGTCFDGWRPKGVLPGDSPAKQFLREGASQHLQPILQHLPEEYRRFIRALFGLEPTSGDVIAPKQ
jgi:hypothetical protein